jgi:hypothetical protein
MAKVNQEKVDTEKHRYPIYLFRRIMDADFGEYWSEVCSLIVLAQWKSQASLSGRFQKAFLCLKIVLSGQILGFAALVSCSSIWSHDDNRLCKKRLFEQKQMVFPGSDSGPTQIGVDKFDTLF